MIHDLDWNTSGSDSESNMETSDDETESKSDTDDDVSIVNNEVETGELNNNFNGNGLVEEEKVEEDEASSSSDSGSEGSSKDNMDTTDLSKNNIIGGTYERTTRSMRAPKNYHAKYGGYIRRTILRRML